MLKTGSTAGDSGRPQKTSVETFMLKPVRPLAAKEPLTMLLILAMLTLICALVAGVFGFDDTAPAFPSLAAGARYLFFPLLGAALAALAGGTLGTSRRRYRYATTTTRRDRRTF